MRLSAQELLLRKRCVFLPTRSTLPTAGGECDQGSSAFRNCTQPVGLQPPTGSDIPVATNRADRALVSAVQAASEILAVRRLNRIEKDVSVSRWPEQGNYPRRDKGRS